MEFGRKSTLFAAHTQIFRAFFLKKSAKSDILPSQLCKMFALLYILRCILEDAKEHIKRGIYDL